MINWTVDEVKFKAQHPKMHKLWRLTQLINYGLDGEKLDKKEVIRNWANLDKKIDPLSRNYLKFLIWGN
ncbi:MAG: hypothetical protein ACD_19C00426G0051 [uncultured bacterium]|nr:MAG: hypothetical protein ACD_19C00426G0051 [uncultured bacterium]